MSQLSRPGASAVLVRLALDSAYVLLSWPVLLGAFVAVVTLLPLSVSLIVIWVGVPLLYLTLAVARCFTALERHGQRLLLDREVPAGVYHRPDPRTSLPRRAWQRLADPQAWVDVVFCLFAWVAALVTWCLALVWWSTAIAGIASPFLNLLRPEDTAGLGDWLFGGQAGYAAHTAADVAVGLIAAATLPWAMRGLAAGQSSLFGAVLSSQALQRRVAQLETSRSAAQDAEAASLHKLERDLHDGPQQRLVRLQMDLGRALHQMDQDPARARTAVESSLTQAHATLDELRNLSRGIAPPILIDRGLVAALDDLAARSAVPAQFTTNLPRDRRPDAVPDRVADATFYLVSEGLTNAAKHAGANAAEVDVHFGEGMLRVVIRDDGVGGAQASRGGGLGGLLDRLAGLDGRLDVFSPVGGPTVLTAIIPCE